MAQSGKTSIRSRKPKTIPIVVLTAPTLVEQLQGASELLATPIQLLPAPVQLEAHELEAKIDDFIGSMLPVTDSIFARQSDASEVASIALALAVTADGQVGLAGVVSAGLQVQASITITLAKKNAANLAHADTRSSSE